MHQMHDELLKLEGQASNANGNGSSLVSSVEDDDWETVGPKNKSAVTRTQDFAPSEVRAIFGGQLRSVVKARGINIKYLSFDLSSSKHLGIGNAIIYLTCLCWDSTQGIKLRLLNSRFFCYILIYLMMALLILRTPFGSFLCQKHLMSIEQHLERYDSCCYLGVFT